MTAYGQVGKWRCGLASRPGERFTSNVGGIISSALVLLYSFHVLITIRQIKASKKHLNKTYQSKSDKSSKNIHKPRWTSGVWMSIVLV